MLMIGNIINLLSKGWALVSSYKMVMSILKNWAFIKETLGSVEKIMQTSIQTHGLPNCDDTRKLIDLLRGALDLGLIDLPNVDEGMISRQLMELENTLVCQVRAIESIQALKSAEVKSE